MKKSRRLVLPHNDYDNELVMDQMSQKFVSGIGFYGWIKGAIIDPAEILGSRPGEVSKAIAEEDEAVIRRSVTYDR
ncbi:MAG: hypothetical protein KAU38_09535 [Desulfobacterales bacterium]|nr:hypothetical protein [Desulfobacterales bacterium]